MRLGGILTKVQMCKYLRVLADVLEERNAAVDVEKSVQKQLEEVERSIPLRIAKALEEGVEELRESLTEGFLREKELLAEEQKELVERMQKEHVEKLRLAENEARKTIEKMGILQKQKKEMLAKIKEVHFLISTHLPHLCTAFLHPWYPGTPEIYSLGTPEICHRRGAGGRR